MTSTDTTFARPYARAAFEFAREKNALPVWESSLQAAAEMVSDKEVKRLLTHPLVTPDSLCHLIESGAKNTNAEFSNFLKVLSSHKRLSILSAVYHLFVGYREAFEKVVPVEMVCAFPVSEAQQQKLVKALEKRFERKVLLTQRVDKSLIGGALIRAGDWVLDDSIQQQLSRLAVECGVSAHS